MKRLHLYLIKSYIGPFILTFFIAMIVLILQFVWKYVDELVGKGLSSKIVFELLLSLSAQLVPLALILAVLLASIMTFGALGEHSELSALKSSGISLFRIMVPVLFLVSTLTFGAYLFSNYVVTATNLKFFTLLMDIREQRPEFYIKEGQFYNDIEGYSLKIGNRSRDGKTLYDLMVYDHTTRAGNVSVTMADSGNMVMTEDKKNLLLTLFNGTSYSEQLTENHRMQDNKPLRRDKFNMQQFLFKLPGNELERTDQELYKDNYKMLTMYQLARHTDTLISERDKKLTQAGISIRVNQLFRFEDKKPEPNPLTSVQDSMARLRINYDSLYLSYASLNKKPVIDYAINLARTSSSSITTANDEYKIRDRWVRWHQVEYHRKMTLSIACLLFLLIGAPLGAIIRKGGLGTPVVVSVAFFIFYHIITLAGEKYAKAGMLPVWLGMWGSTMILFPIGVFLTIKSTRDSIILNTDTYFSFLRNFFRFGRRSRKSLNENSPAN